MISQAGDGVIGGPRFGGITEDQITKIETDVRSVYLPVPRNLLPDVLELFDFPDNSLVHGTRETTLVPGQSLFWMNSQMVDRAAQHIARRAFPGFELFVQPPKPQSTGSNSSRNSPGSPPSTGDRGERGTYEKQASINAAERFTDICLLTTRPSTA